MGGLVPGAGSVGPGREAVGLLASLGSHNVVDAPLAALRHCAFYEDAPGKHRRSLTNSTVVTFN